MTATHMVQLTVDTLRLMRLARERRLARRQVDLGYLTHCQLGETFGEFAPRPFSIVTRRDEHGEPVDPLAQGDRELTVLAYSQCDARALESHAREVASPERYASIDWARLASKPMPDTWQAGRRLRFDVRACPVVRMAQAGEHHKKGAEVDAFVRACWRAGRDVPVVREEVYRDWLTEQLVARGARALEITIDAMRIAPIVRRDHQPARTSRMMRRPDVRFRGVLEVTDPAKFAPGLFAGIGRHRGFGFGMLLVKPV